MAEKLEVKRFSSPDETRPFIDHGEAAILRFGEETVGLASFEPGWRWSKDLKPIAGTQSCQETHYAYFLSGRMHIVMDSGEEVDAKPGDFVFIPPGHDGWVLGDETVRAVDFRGMEHYAERGRAPSVEAERPGAH